MLEVDLTYDLSPNFDMASYGEWAKCSAGVIKNQPGMVKFHGHRNVFGTPRIRTSSAWRRPEDWDRFTKSTDWFLIREELSSFASDVKVDIRSG